MGLIVFSILFIMNVLGFGLYAIDKHCAVYGKWRIPESLLLCFAIAGGAYGAGMGMLLFHHKTRHGAFLITVPLCFVVWIIILVILTMR